MPRIYYSFFLCLLIPGILLRLWFRSFSNPDYRQRIGERFALNAVCCGTIKEKPLVMVHAVSVGEVMAATPLITELLKRGNRVLVTTMTPTGSDTISAQLGDKVFHCYLPYDLPFTMDRFLSSIKPDLIVLMETELWPNLIHVSAKKHIPIVLANARMSRRSERGYKRFNNLTRDMLKKFNHIAAQSTEDQERLINLGAESNLTSVTGSIKFNVSVAEKARTRDSFMQSVLDSGRPVFIAASTREGEEEKVLEAFKTATLAIPDLLLILVPRHLERFNSVANLVKAHQLSLLRRSDMKRIEPGHQVFLGDSMGEMMTYYSLAKIAFVGGSLVDTGCQNVLEPAATGLPVLVGPSQYNFDEICRQLEAAGGLKTVEDQSALARALVELLKNTSQAKEMGQRALKLVTDNQQALPKLMNILSPLITQ